MWASALAKRRYHYSARPRVMTSRARGRCREFPSVVELTSYVFCFHGMMCGPFCFYKDYVAFVDGSNYARHAAATGNGGLWDRRRGGGAPGGRHPSSHGAGDVVSAASDGRSGNNSHARLPAPPDPGVLRSFHTGLIYSATNGLADAGCSYCRIIMYWRSSFQ